MNKKTITSYVLDENGHWHEIEREVNEDVTNAKFVSTVPMRFLTKDGWQIINEEEKE